MRIASRRTQGGDVPLCGGCGGFISAYTKEEKKTEDDAN